MRFLTLLLLLLALGQPAFNQNDLTSPYGQTVKKAEAHYRAGDYRAAPAAYEAALATGREQCLDLYNAACCAGLTGAYDEAARYLSVSIEMGYIDKAWMLEDDDFAGLRNTGHWEKLIAQIDRRVAAVKTALSRVKDHELTQLIPFLKAGRWGYLAKSTKEIVVPAVFADAGFAGDCLPVDLTGRIRINVDAAGDFQVYRPDSQSYLPPKPPDHVLRGAPKVDTTADFEGFRVGPGGRITHVSAIYEGPEVVLMGFDQGMGGGAPLTPEVEIEGPFKIDGKWHAAVKKDGKWGVINEEGRVLEAVPFQYQELIPVPATYGQLPWFYAVEENGRRGFVSAEGEKRLFGEFDDSPFSLPSLNEFGLAKVRHEGREGIIDLTGIKWMLPPGEESVVYRALGYTFEGDCRQALRQAPSAVIDFYFLAQEEDGTLYYVGADGEKYLPE